MKQKKQKEWFDQWSMLKDEEIFLFKEWIYPNRIEDFKDKEVLECGCGGGQHTFFIAPYARKIAAVDLNTAEIAKQRNKNFTNIEFIEDDIAKMDLGRQFDIVFSIGVIHHTDNPDKTVENLKRHIKKGGRLILWVYAKEGNFLVRSIVEPARKLFLSKLGRKELLLISRILTLFMYFPIYTIYFLPLRALPYYEYFKNFRRLSYYRNTLNVFDKLNAPQVQFIDNKRITQWFGGKEFKNIHLSFYKGVSWRGSGDKI